MSFTEELKAENNALWQQAISHRFVQELFDGTIADQHMASYLVQDYRFLDSFLALIGAGIAQADLLSSRLSLASFAGEIAGDENTYFLRSFQALGISEEERKNTPDADPTQRFIALFKEAATSNNYAAILAVLTVAEWLYQEWAVQDTERPEYFVYREWIELHDFPEFHERVAFLRSELDRVGPSEAEVAREFFRRAVAIELEFFNEVYV